VCLSQTAFRETSVAGDCSHHAGFRVRARAHVPPNCRTRDEGFRLRNPRELVCPAGKTLKRSTYYKRDEAWLYAARVKDCQACPRRLQCLPPSSKRRFVQLSEYEPEFDRASETNATVRHRRLARRRKTVVEGVFARLDRLGFRRTYPGRKAPVHDPGPTPPVGAMPQGT
jgi:hypothetical protein